MKKIFKTIGIIIIAFIIVFSCNKILFNKHEEDVSNYPAMRTVSPVIEIKRTVDAINREMPIKVNEHTTAVRTEYLEKKNIFVLYYQLNDVKKGDLTEKEVDNIVQSLKAVKLEHTMSNPNNKTFVEQRVTFEYVYKDINEDVIYSFQIEPQEYLHR